MFEIRSRREAAEKMLQSRNNSGEKWQPIRAGARQSKGSRLRFVCSSRSRASLHALALILKDANVVALDFGRRRMIK
jgi:hypothetical protein